MNSVFLKNCWLHIKVPVGTQCVCQASDTVTLLLATVSLEEIMFFADIILIMYIHVYVCITVCLCVLKCMYVHIGVWERFG